MPGFKTIGFVVPALLAVAGTYADDSTTALAHLISQCKHNFAYTFENGPTSLNTPLVNKFDSVGGKTTFFVNGDREGLGGDASCIYADENVRALRYGFEHGHQYASTMWSYETIPPSTEAEIDEGILRLDEAFVKILGVKPKFLRPPWGEIDFFNAQYIQRKHGKTIVLWDEDSVNQDPGGSSNADYNYIDFYKSLATEGANSTHLVRSVELRATAPSSSTLDPAVGRAVDALHNAGITLLTVAGCLDLEPYEHIGSYGERDDTWTCNGPWTPSSVSHPTTPAPTTPASTSTRPVPSSSSSVPTTKATRSSASTHPVPSVSSSAPPTKATPSSVPDGPKCVTQNYQSLEGEDCSSIETKFALQAGSVSAANTFVNCSDIWTGTNLSICVPTLSKSNSRSCKRTKNDDVRRSL